jgi:hypothetical protein
MRCKSTDRSRASPVLPVTRRADNRLDRDRIFVGREPRFGGALYLPQHLASANRVGLETFRENLPGLVRMVFVCLLLFAARKIPIAAPIPRAACGFDTER